MFTRSDRDKKTRQSFEQLHNSRAIETIQDMSKMSTIAIFGATGNIGRFLLPLLVCEEAIEEIRIVTKRPENIDVNHPKTRGKKIVVQKGDYCGEKTTVVETLSGCSRLFLVLPQSLSSQEMILKGKFVVDCAVAANVESIVRISSLGIDDQSINFVGSQGPLGEAHVAIEEYCKKVDLKHVSLRPTSLFSNIHFNSEEILSKSTISTPLGNDARVNWVSCEDVANVAAKVLVAKKWDAFGTIIDITGPSENTLGAQDMAKTISASLGKPVEYKETDVPPVPDYGGLWKFLRKGGYDCHCDSVQKITGSPGQCFSQLKVT